MFVLIFLNEKFVYESFYRTNNKIKEKRSTFDHSVSSSAAKHLTTFHTQFSNSFCSRCLQFRICVNIYRVINILLKNVNNYPSFFYFLSRKCFYSNCVKLSENMRKYTGLIILKTKRKAINIVRDGHI